MKKVIIIAGATASGKTAVAVQVAKNMNTEIISADSMQIYKTLNIGTAKATSSEMGGIKHHMIDVVSPNETYSVAQYAKQGKECIDKIFSENKTPIICGGTGLYINSLIYERSFGKAVGNDEIRLKYMNMLHEKGNEYLFSYLSQIDEQSAQKLHKNDSKRVIRALEIFEITGKKKSDQDDSKQLLYDVDFYCLESDRAILYERINERVDYMITHGLVEEVLELYKSVPITSQCFTAIGYKEFVDYFNNRITMQECIQKIKQNSRNYAKRQLTWFRNQPNIKMLQTSGEIKQLVDQICNSF